MGRRAERGGKGGGGQRSIWVRPPPNSEASPPLVLMYLLGEMVHTELGPVVDGSSGAVVGGGADVDVMVEVVVVVVVVVVTGGYMQRGGVLVVSNTS